MYAEEADNTLFIQFARSPVVGAVKTRMFPRLSAEQACELHCDLVLWTARQLVASQLGRVYLAVAGEPDHPVFSTCRELGVDEISEQVGVGLGERMSRAMERALRDFDKVVLVGSDCPTIDRAYLAQAVEALDVVPLVLGPATDGGYVLVGARGTLPAEMFTEISWGSSRVYAQTVARLQKVGWNWRALPVKSDIDRPEDLALWERAIERGAG